jgi:hypothetical protein
MVAVHAESAVPAVAPPSTASTSFWAPGAMVTWSARRVSDASAPEPERISSPGTIRRIAPSGVPPRFSSPTVSSAQRAPSRFAASGSMGGRRSAAARAPCSPGRRAPCSPGR